MITAECSQHDSQTDPLLLPPGILPVGPTGVSPGLSVPAQNAGLTRFQDDKIRRYAQICSLTFLNHFT